MQATDPYWWEDAGRPELPPERAPPDEADVAVIGAGLTGLGAALTLARAGRSVLVLEAGVPGAQASGRNGGMIGGGHRLSPGAMRAQFGEDTARRMLHEAHLASHAFCRGLMRAEKIACDYVESGRFRGLWRNGEYEEEARALADLQATVPVEAEAVPRHRQREAIDSDLYRGGVLFHRHGGLNPAKWVGGLLRAAQAAGALILGETPVLSVMRTGAGFALRTSRGEVRAGAVLAATNGYTTAALPRLRRLVLPVPSFIVVTEPLGKARLDRMIPKGRMIVESRDRHCYFRPSPDGERLIFGARAAMFDAPENFVRRQMLGLIARVFPGLGPLGLSHSWRGRTGFSFDFLPHVGRIGGIWHAAGYSGSGNAMAPYLGHKAALGILGDPEGDTAFAETDFPTRWWHRGAPWVLPIADLAFRLKDLQSTWRRGA